jgi:hypothetical protein
MFNLVLGRPKSLGADDAIRLKIRQYVDHCSFNAMHCPTNFSLSTATNGSLYYLLL